jgi:hypothetical protein
VDLDPFGLDRVGHRWWGLGDHVPDAERSERTGHHRPAGDHTVSLAPEAALDQRLGDVSDRQGGRVGGERDRQPQLAAAGHELERAGNRLLAEPHRAVEVEDGGPVAGEVERFGHGLSRRRTSTCSRRRGAGSNR